MPAGCPSITNGEAKATRASKNICDRSIRMASSGECSKLHDQLLSRILHLLFRPFGKHQHVKGTRCRSSDGAARLGLDDEAAFAFIPRELRPGVLSTQIVEALAVVVIQHELAV